MKRSLQCFLIVAVLQMQQVAFAAGQVESSELIRANNAFAIDLYLRMAEQPGNFVFSPFSIDTSFTMACAGARGNTARQITKALHYSDGETNVHAEFAALLQQLKAIDTPVTRFLVANSLWAQTGYPFFKPFQELLRDRYEAGLNIIDLTGWPNEFDPAIAKAARNRINNWVATRTNGKIMQMLPPTLPQRNTRLILVDAVYFDGLWATPFEAKQTTNAPFQISPSESASVPTMHLKASLGYFENADVQALRLPYVSNRLSMFILLPKKKDGLPQLEQELASQQIKITFEGTTIKQNTKDSYLQNLCDFSRSPSLVAVSLPRFSEKSEFDLKKLLKAMGVRDCFDGAADFSRITPATPFWIDAAIHKAFISVDEQGTEATAATFLEFVDSHEPPETKTFNADHPFLYLIRDDASGVILFMGRFVDPSKN